MTREELPRLELVASAEQKRVEADDLDDALTELVGIPQAPQRLVCELGTVGRVVSSPAVDRLPEIVEQRRKPDPER